jgi:hypothetical protein
MNKPTLLETVERMLQVSIHDAVTNINSPLGRIWAASDNFVITSKNGEIYLHKCRSGIPNRFITQEELYTLADNSQELTVIIPRTRLLNTSGEKVKELLTV